MKLPSAIILAAIPMVLLFQGCIVALPLLEGGEKIRDVSLQPPYSQWIGKKFVLQQDCYVYRYTDDSKTLYVGTGGGSLPEKVDVQFVGKRLNHVKIAGILEKESVFTIVGCMEIQNPENGTWRDFEATFENPTFQGQILDVSFLTDSTEKPPVFKPNMVKSLD